MLATLILGPDHETSRRAYIVALSDNPSDFMRRRGKGIEGKRERKSMFWNFLVILGEASPDSDFRF